MSDVRCKKEEGRRKREEVRGKRAEGGGIHALVLFFINHEFIIVEQFPLIPFVICGICIYDY